MQEAQKSHMLQYKCKHCDKGKILVVDVKIKCTHCNGRYEIKIISEEDVSKYFSKYSDGIFT